jgi:hypothetical protein
MIQELSNIEIIEISGGHEGTAYQAGQEFRKALDNAMLIIVGVLFFR